MAEEKKDTAAEVEAKIDTAGPQKSPIVLVVLVLNLVVMGAVGYFQYQMFQKQASQPDIRDIIKAEMQQMEEGEEQIEGGQKPVAESGGEMMVLDPFTANLAQGDGPKRFIRLNAVLKFSADANQEEFKSRKAQIRDSIISVLNSKRPEDLLKVEGKNYLKEEIKAAINSFFVDGSVTDVFYTSFQIN